MALSPVYPRQIDTGGHDAILPAPAGVTPDYVKAHNNLWQVNIACQALCIILVGSCVMARTYAKLFIKPGLKIEDYSCLLAWIFALALTGIALACNKRRAGEHMWNVTPDDFQSFIHLQYFGELLYYCSAFFTKASILLLIARIFAPHKKAVLITRLFLSIIVFYYLPAFFIKLFRCNPIRKTWLPTIDGKCILVTEYNILYSDCIISIITNLGILLIPLPMVWALQTSLRRKMRVFSVFAGGIVACAATSARIAAVTTLNPDDATYTVTIIMLWAIAEVNVGIICSCLPILPSFYKYMVRSAKARISHHTASYYELEGAGRKSGTVDRAAPEDIERGKMDKVQALAKHYLGPTGDVQGTSSYVTAGPENLTPTDELWGGDGILKTVKVEQMKTPAPRPGSLLARPPDAVLPVEQARSI